MEAVSGTTTVRFDGKTIIISRRPKRGMSLIGAGDTVIPLASVQSIEWKPAGRFSMGHIRFSVAGSQTAATQTPIQRDPNAAAFPRGHAAAFEKLNVAVQQALASR